LLLFRLPTRSGPGVLQGVIRSRQGKEGSLYVTTHFPVKGWAELLLNFKSRYVLPAKTASIIFSLIAFKYFQIYLNIRFSAYCGICSAILPSVAINECSKFAVLQDLTLFFVNERLSLVFMNAFFKLMKQYTIDSPQNELKR